MRFIFLIPVILGLAVAGPMSPFDHDGNILERQLIAPREASISEQEEVRMRLIYSSEAYCSSTLSPSKLEADVND